MKYIIETESNETFTCKTLDQAMKLFSEMLQTMNNVVLYKLTMLNDTKHYWSILEYSNGQRVPLLTKKGKHITIIKTRHINKYIK